MAVTARAVGFLRQRSRQRGLLGDSSRWLGIYVLLTGARALRRFFSPKPAVISERLEPGQMLVVTHRTSTRRQLRRQGLKVD